jgi:chaperonin cofactor prefoldin
MNQSIGFFNKVAGVGSKILEVLGGKPASAEIKRYLERVAEIYNLLVDIHDEVVKVAVKTSLAANMNEAREALKEIEYSSLENTFRARRWCDELQRLGQALRPLSQDAGLSGDDQQTWDEFCSALERREGEVVYLYIEKLYDFRRLAYPAYSDLSLKSLKEKVEDIRKRLVTQKAQFDHLAKKAEAMRKRLG